MLLIGSGIVGNFAERAHRFDALVLVGGDAHVSARFDVVAERGASEGLSELVHHLSLVALHVAERVRFRFVFEPPHRLHQTAKLVFDLSHKLRILLGSLKKKVGEDIARVGLLGGADRDVQGLSHLAIAFRHMTLFVTAQRVAFLTDLDDV